MKTPVFATKVSDDQRVSRSDVRRQLGDDLAASYNKVRGAIESAMEADREHRVSCPGCKRRFEIRVPDHVSRLRAVDLWLAQGFGTPPKDQTTPLAGKGALLADLETMSDQALELYILGASSEEDLAADRAYRETIRAIADAPGLSFGAKALTVMLSRFKSRADLRVIADKLEVELPSHHLQRPQPPLGSQQ